MGSLFKPPVGSAINATNAGNADTLDTKHYSDLQSEFATINHDHVINDITDLNINNFATTNHTHSVYALLANGVTNGDSHDHNGGDGAQISYTTLSDVPLTFTPASHNHAISDVTNISTTFATINHDHVIADITDLNVNEFATTGLTGTSSTSFKINNTDDWGATAVQDGSTLSVINMPYCFI